MNYTVIILQKTDYNKTRTEVLIVEMNKYFTRIVIAVHTHDARQWDCHSAAYIVNLSAIQDTTKM